LLHVWGGTGNILFRHFLPDAIFQTYLELTFTEAAKGANKTIHLEMMDTCPRCDGKGNEKGTKISQCGYCGGSGMVSVRKV